MRFKIIIITIFILFKNIYIYTYIFYSKFYIYKPKINFNVLDNSYNIENMFLIKWYFYLVLTFHIHVFI